MQNKRDAFLDLFTDISPGQRGALADLFFHPIRGAGLTDPAQVCRAVYLKALHAWRAARADAEQRKWYRLMEAMKTQRQLALAMAEWALWWDALPGGEKAAIREPRQEQYKREWMESQPATQKQIGYLLKLGYRGEIPNRLRASQLIEEIKQRRSAG